MTWFTLLIACLASARLWRLATLDGITFWFRNLVDRAPGWVYDLVYCPFCLGWWISLFLVTTGFFWGETVWWLIPVGALAANYVGAQLNAWLDIKPVTDSGGEIPKEESL